MRKCVFIECKPDWLDTQCSKVLEILSGLTSEQKRGVTAQVEEYLEMEEAEKRLDNQ